MSQPPARPVPPPAAPPAEGLAAAAMFTSAFLLFAVQPLVARQLLPGYGGSAAVWNTAQVVFQALLLLGYAYAHAAGRLAPRRQVAVHAAVVAAAALMLPPALRLGARPPAGAWPVPWVVLAVGAAVALPFFALAANSTLVQAWQVARRPGVDAYRLYAASNLGSLAALACYPLLVEPRLGLAAQRALWSVGFAAFALLTALGMVRVWRAAAADGRGGGAGGDGSVDSVGEGAAAAGARDADAVRAAGASAADGASPAAPTRLRRLGWAVLAGVPVGLSLSTSLALSTEIAATPLFWTVPLAVYLLTYILAFGWPDRIPRGWAAASARFCVAVSLLGAVTDLPFIAPLSLATLFAGALLCHLDLANDRPAPAHLSSFYLWLAIGGLAGGALNSLVAPVVLDRVTEYPLTLAVVAALALPRAGRRGRAGIAFALAAAALAIWSALGAGESGTTVRTARSFFGVVRVADLPGERVLIHGATQHGSQRTSDHGRRIPTRYFHPAGPLGAPLAALGDGARIGVIGLGTGALAALTKPGQHLTFYEIDPLIEDVARAQFSYLADAAGTVDVRIGDGRLLLAAEPDARFDLVVVDAFSGDVVPVHLLTAEAIDAFRAKLAPGGLLVLHVSSRWLALDRVLAGYAARRPDAKLAAADWDPDSVARAEGASRTLAVAVANDAATLDRLTDAGGGLWRPLDAGARAQWWTDDRSDLLGVMK